MTFSEVLRAHAARYPEMREGDFLKLCYQHALGCGHLVKDEAEAVRRIRAERAPGEEGVSFESIGNGLVRMHLKGMDARFSDEIAARMFMYTAETFHPAPDALESALQTLAETFPTDAMRAAIAAYRAEGCPMVSHTEAYRRAYAPAYRVVSERFARYAALFEAAARLPEGAIFALDGMCASGKTSLSNALGFVFRAPVFHMDDFFLPAEKRTKERLSEVGGNVDRERFREEDFVRFHPIINSGGDLVNVIPDFVKMESYTRAANVEALLRYNTDINRALKAGADAVGATFELHDLPGYLPLLPDEAMRGVLRDNAVALFGEDHVAVGEHSAGSTEMGDVSHLMPVVHPWVGCAKGVLHGANFVLDNEEVAYEKSPEVLAMTIIDLLWDDAAKAEEICANFKPVFNKETYCAFQDKIASGAC